jgi:hypothetical protein
MMSKESKPKSLTIAQKRIMEINPNAGMRKCLGENCGCWFFSTGAGHRYCSECIQKREEAPRSGIRIVPSHGEL